ncbi:hypothetical protein E5Q_04110 [Mixia osmundae IAM 14324]|uniref:DBF4-type domain-containing protein n=1 Tax=Mixia osmundae (strain CBS 9802 / IAM 14324 / JCM 22182 / KY 12970) TaxID=764103 RepID=G7E3M3_MIXOS|nr:hypothetical protein E5Q_04110 [Mixia osmundae IAM 14324]
MQSPQVATVRSRLVAFERAQIRLAARTDSRLTAASLTTHLTSTHAWVSSSSGRAIGKHEAAKSRIMRKPQGVVAPACELEEYETSSSQQRVTSGSSRASCSSPSHPTIVRSDESQSRSHESVPSTTLVGTAIAPAHTGSSNSLLAAPRMVRERQATEAGSISSVEASSHVNIVRADLNPAHMLASRTRSGKARAHAGSPLEPREAAEKAFSSSNSPAQSICTDGKGKKRALTPQESIELDAPERQPRETFATLNAQVSSHIAATASLGSEEAVRTSLLAPATPERDPTSTETPEQSVENTDLPVTMSNQFVPETVEEELQEQVEHTDTQDSLVTPSPTRKSIDEDLELAIINWPATPTETVPAKSENHLGKRAAQSLPTIAEPAKRPRPLSNVEDRAAPGARLSAKRKANTQARQKITVHVDQDVAVHKSQALQTAQTLQAEQDDDCAQPKLCLNTSQESSASQTRKALSTIGTSKSPVDGSEKANTPFAHWPGQADATASLPRTPPPQALKVTPQRPAPNSRTNTSKPGDKAIRDSFKAESAEWKRKYRRAFKGYVFYFEAVDPIQQVDLEDQILELDAHLDRFFSKRVTHVVTNRAIPLLPTLTKTQPWRGMSQEPVTAPKANQKTVGNLRSPLKLLKNETASYDSRDVLVKAQEFGLKIWSLEKLSKMLFQLSHTDSPKKRNTDAALSKQSLPSLLRSEAITGRTRETAADALRPDYRYFNPRTAFVLIEDMAGEHRPIAVKEYATPLPPMSIFSKSSKQTPDWPVLYGGAEGRGAFTRNDQAAPLIKPKAQCVKAHVDVAARAVAAAGTQSINLRKSVSMTALSKRHGKMPLGDITNKCNEPCENNAVFQQASGNSVSITSNIASTTSNVRSGPHLAHGQAGYDKSIAMLDKKQYVSGARQPRLSVPTAEASQGGFKVPTLPAGPSALRRSISTDSGLQRQAVPMVQRQAQPKPGYCENCRAKYSDFDRHVVCSKHRRYALNLLNWVDLDVLIAQLKRPHHPSYLHYKIADRMRSYAEVAELDKPQYFENSEKELIRAFIAREGRFIVPGFRLQPHLCIKINGMTPANYWNMVRAQGLYIYWLYRLRALLDQDLMSPDRLAIKAMLMSDIRKVQYCFWISEQDDPTQFGGKWWETKPWPINYQAQDYNIEVPADFVRKMTRSSDEWSYLSSDEDGDF